MSHHRHNDADFDTRLNFERGLLVLELTSSASESSEPRGIMDYVRLARKIDSDAQFEKAPANRRIKIAVLSSFTLGGFKEALLVRCVDEGISPKIYIGGYNQYNQEILDPASALYSFHPDLVILMLDTRTIAGEHYLQPYAMTDDQRRE